MKSAQSVHIPVVAEAVRARLLSQSHVYAVAGFHSTPKERQGRVSSRLAPLVQGFHGPFATDRRAEEDSHTINDIVMSEASASKANLFFSGGTHPLTLHVMNHHSDFPKPAGRHRGYVSARLDSDRRGRDIGQRSS
jgi:hypothetical protein